MKIGHLENREMVQKYKAAVVIWMDGYTTEGCGGVCVCALFQVRQTDRAMFAVNGKQH